MEEDRSTLRVVQSQSKQNGEHLPSFLSKLSGILEEGRDGSVPWEGNETGEGVPEGP
jgi:hypothetical protein